MSFKVCCFPDLICCGSFKCSVTVMTHASVPMSLDTDVMFSKGKLKILGGSWGDYEPLYYYFTVHAKGQLIFWVCIFKQNEC